MAEDFHCLNFMNKHTFIDFPGGSDGKASAYNARGLGSIPGSGRSGEGNALNFLIIHADQKKKEKKNYRFFLA